MKPKIYFPGLNELRAIAAFFVIPGHVEWYKSVLGFPFRYWFPIPGVLGVVLFFALSGFLITTLLLNEINTSSTINFKFFYIKRILRIWPLYFLVIGVSILVFNQLAIFQISGMTKAFYEGLDSRNIVILLLVAPNFISVAIPYLGQVWSIGIEQQFYLVQPLIVRFFKNKYVLAVVLFGLVFSKEALVFVENRLSISFNPSIVHQSPYYGVLAIGCLGAVLYDLYPGFVKKHLHHLVTQVAAVLAFIAFLVVINITGKELVIDARWHALAFSLIILNAATNPSSFLNLKNKTLDYLGKISYGIYMYHAMCIGIAIKLADFITRPLGSMVVFNLLVYFFALALTILVSHLSYTYFEGFFLKQKARFKP